MDLDLGWHTSRAQPRNLLAAMGTIHFELSTTSADWSHSSSLRLAARDTERVWSVPHRAPVPRVLPLTPATVANTRCLFVLAARKGMSG